MVATCNKKICALLLFSLVVNLVEMFAVFEAYEKNWENKVCYSIQPWI